MEEDWNPSWSDEEDDNDLNFHEQGNQHKHDHKLKNEKDVAKTSTARVNDSVTEENPDTTGEGNLFRRKFYNKEDLFKKLTGGTSKKGERQQCNNSTSLNDKDQKNKRNGAAELTETNFPSNNFETTTGVTSKSNELECKECGKRFAKRIHLVLHQKIHAKMDKQTAPNSSNSQYLCTSCGSRFERNEDLVSHVENEHGSSFKTDELEFKCEKCCRSFGRLNQLKLHGRLCKSTDKSNSVNKQTRQSQLSKQDLEPLTKTSNVTTFSCSDCDRQFKLQFHLKLHMRSHTKICKNCKFTCHEREFEDHCKTCANSSKYSKSSIAEVADSTKCNTCGKELSTRIALSEHHLLHDYSIESFQDCESDHVDFILPFACQYGECKSRFSHESDLECHQQNLHKMEVLGLSNPTHYYIQDEQLPPINPYVLISNEIRQPADAYLKSVYKTPATSTPKLRTRRFKKPRGGRQRLDIPYQDFYICKTCNKKFYKRNPYINHIAAHVREEKFTCKICERKFHAEALYNAHIALHSDPTYESRPRYRYREDVPFQSVYTCETCGEKFVKRNLYLLHMREEKFKCTLCDRKFQSDALLKAHIERHKDPSYDPDSRGKGRPFRTDIPIQSVYTCKSCFKPFTDRHLFLVHLSNHKREEKFTCKICDLKHVSSLSLELHMKRHSDPTYVPRKRGKPRRFDYNIPYEESYECEACKETFEERQVYLLHMANHKREKCKCNICGQGHATPLALQSHMRRHLDPSFRPRHPRSRIPIQDVYTCEKCDKSFTKRQRYICHLFYHRNGKGSNTGKPLKPQIATVEKRWIEPERQKTRYDIPVQEVYHCEQCDYKKSFTDRQKYIHHLRYHSLEKSHKCDGCLKLFKTVQSRDLHRDKFCKGIPCKLKCDRCGDRFHNKITLARHIQRHHSKILESNVAEIEYPCNQCSQTFNTTFGLTRHKQVYHPVSDVMLERDTPQFLNEDHDGGEGENSSHSWSAEEDNPLLAASFCQAELSETPEQNNSQIKAPKRKIPRGSTLCQCGVNKKYKSQKFCHSLRCSCVQAGNRCSKNCDCDETCLNSIEMENEQQQKFKEGKESMMQDELDEFETNASTPVVIGYSETTFDDNYHVANTVPSTSSLGYSKLIPTSEFISVDGEQDESMRQLTLEGYVEGAEDVDPFADPLEVPKPEPPKRSSMNNASSGESSSKRFQQSNITQSTTYSTVTISQTPPLISNSTNSSTSNVSKNSNLEASLSGFNQSASLRCQFCKKTFKLMPIYISHILLHYDLLLLQKSSLVCPICTKMCGNKITAYAQHLNSHNKGIDLQCSKCSSKFKSYKDMDKHLQVHHFRPMECGICKLKFSSSQLMMTHWSSTHPTCQCGLCNVKFFSYDDLTFHMKSLHSPYDCLRCHERFENLEGLLDHFDQKHSLTASTQSQNQPSTSLIKFKCNYCDHTFSNGEDLNEHLSSHLSNTQGENQYQASHNQCHECKATFTTAEELHDHLAHHLMGTSTTYTSNSASNSNRVNSGIQMAFSTSTSEIEIEQVEDDVLNDNIQAVEVLACPKCGKTFQNRTGLRTHLLIHKLFVCSACDSCFDTKEELLNHLQVTSCIVHFCDVCDRNFQAKSYLMQHKRFVHNGEKRSSVTARNSGAKPFTEQSTETGGSNVNSFPVIVASTSLAQNTSAKVQSSTTYLMNGSSYTFPQRQAQKGTQREIEEITLD